jgi:hypothetical protein
MDRVRPSSVLARETATIPGLKGDDITAARQSDRAAV